MAWLPKIKHRPNVLSLIVLLADVIGCTTGKRDVVLITKSAVSTETTGEVETIFTLYLVPEGVASGITPFTKGVKNPS